MDAIFRKLDITISTLQQEGNRCQIFLHSLALHCSYLEGINSCIQDGESKYMGHIFDLVVQHFVDLIGLAEKRKGKEEKGSGRGGRRYH